MSNLNYARIRNSQKKSDCNIESKNLDFSVPLDIHPSNPNSFPVGDRTVFPSSTSAKIESSNLKNLFGENVHMDNLNYINDMLKSTLPGPLTKPQRKKRGKEKADDEVVIQAPISSPEKVIAPIQIPDDTLNAPVPSLVVHDPNSSRVLVVNTDDGANRGTDTLKVPKSDEGKAKLNCERNMSSTLPTKEAEMYAECFQGEENDSIKRSMSVEDIRIPKRETPKMSIYGKANYYIATEEPETQGKELVDTRIALDSGYNRSAKSDFAASLGQYIDYFQKSEIMQYRTIKASQYFVNSVGRGVNSQNQIQNSVQGQIQSQRSSQPTMNAEMEKMKSQIKKLKEKVHDLQLSNELLYKERKGWKRKHQDLLLRAETAEGDLVKVLKKNKQYKEKLKYTEELLQREKLDNESNLLALKRVLANNISTVLEHRISHYMGSHRESPRDRKQPKNAWPDAKHLNSKSSAKEKEKKSASTYAGSTIHQNGHDYEESHNVKNRYHKGSLQDKMSPLLSHKEPSFSDDEDLKGIHEKFGNLSHVEDLYDEFDDREKLGRRKKQQISQFSMRPSDLDTSSEPTEELVLQNYGGQQRTSDKIQQIQYLQNKLARLIDKDDSLSHTNSLYGQSKGPAKNYETAATPKSHRMRGHTNSLYNYKSQQNHSWNTINVNRKVHETLPPTELHSQPSLH